MGASGCTWIYGQDSGCVYEIDEPSMNRQFLMTFNNVTTQKVEGDSFYYAWSTINSDRIRSKVEACVHLEYLIEIRSNLKITSLQDAIDLIFTYLTRQTDPSIYDLLMTSDGNHFDKNTGEDNITFTINSYSTASFPQNMIVNPITVRSNRSMTIVTFGWYYN